MVNGEVHRAIVPYVRLCLCRGWYCDSKVFYNNYGLDRALFLSTHADRQGEDISVTVCLFFVCAVTDLSGQDKAIGVKFCRMVHGRSGQGIFHLGERCSPRSPKSAPGSKDCRQTPVPFTDSALSVSGGDWHLLVIRTLGMCGYTAVSENGRIFSIA